MNNVTAALPRKSLLEHERKFLKIAGDGLAQEKVGGAAALACLLDMVASWHATRVNIEFGDYCKRWVAEGNVAGAIEVKAAAEAKIAILLDQLDCELARHGQDWFMGATYSALDPYVFTLCRWTRNFASLPARGRPQLGPYLLRMLERPAVQRVLAAEQLQPPFV